MNCPYCASEVPQAAIVCPQCARDFYLFKPILQRIAQLESRLAEQAAAGSHEPRLSALEREFQELKAALSAGRAGGPPGLETVPYAPISGEAKAYRTSLFRALGLTLALLIAAHILLLFVYDASPLYLRVASMLIPVPFGFALAARHPGRFGLSAACGFTMAALAVWLMLVTTGYLDNVPVLPQSVRDVREVVEYAASIGLAFVTGLLLGKLRHRRLRVGAEPDRLAVLLAELFTTDRDGELGVLRLAGRIQKFVSTVTPVGTGLASLYAGIKALIGDLG